MNSNRLTVQMILASAVSAASSTFFLTVLILWVELAESAASIGGLTARLLISLFFALMVSVGLIVPAVALAGLPTFLVGTFLWQFARSRSWARHPLAFAAAGALMGLVVYGALFGTGYMSPDEVPLLEARGQLAIAGIFGCAGACAGMVFRSVANLLTRQPDDEVGPLS